MFVLTWNWVSLGQHSRGNITPKLVEGVFFDIFRTQQAVGGLKMSMEILGRLWPHFFPTSKNHHTVGALTRRRLMLYDPGSWLGFSVAPRSGRTRIISQPAAAPTVWRHRKSCGRFSAWDKWILWKFAAGGSGEGWVDSCRNFFVVSVVVFLRALRMLEEHPEL